MDETLKRIVECIGPRHGAKKELAEYLNIHPNVITNWLNGRNKSYHKYLPQIATYYNVSIDYLLGKEQENEPNQKAGQEMTFDDFTYAMQNETKGLTDADKELLLSMARQLNSARTKKNGETD